jgi:membrane protein DedA with SNARE-associated domain
VLTRIVFFALATVAAFMAATCSAAAMILIGYLAHEQMEPVFTAAAPLSITVFGITIAVFSMAGSLFLADKKSSETHDKSSGDE